MKKKNYEQPEMKVVMLEQTGIICTSNETLQDGGDIFGAKSAYYNGEEFFDF